MAKRRSRRRHTNPFTSYMDLFRAGMDMTELFHSSAQVISHRSKMLSDALEGKLPLHHKEFQEMWHEKMIAGAESMQAAMRHFGSSGVDAFFLSKIMAPYRKKASSNARRLRKK